MPARAAGPQFEPVDPDERGFLGPAAGERAAVADRMLATPVAGAVARAHVL